MKEITLDHQKILKYNIDRINMEYVYSDLSPEERPEYQPYIQRIFTKNIAKFRPDFSKNYLKQISQTIKWYIYKTLWKDKISIEYEQIKYVTENIIMLTKTKNLKEFVSEDRIKNHRSEKTYIYFEDKESAKRLFEILQKKLR